MRCASKNPPLTLRGSFRGKRKRTSPRAETFHSAGRVPLKSERSSICRKYSPSCYSSCCRHSLHEDFSRTAWQDVLLIFPPFPSFCIVDLGKWKSCFRLGAYISSESSESGVKAKISNDKQKQRSSKNKRLTSRKIFAFDSAFARCECALIRCKIGTGNGTQETSDESTKFSLVSTHLTSSGLSRILLVVFRNVLNLS